MPKSLKFFLHENVDRVNFFLLFISFITAKSFNQAFSEDLKAEREAIYCSRIPEELRSIVSYITGSYGAMFMMGAFMVFSFYLILTFFGKKPKRKKRSIFALTFFIIFTFIYTLRFLTTAFFNLSAGI
jgi:hypothetical protein